MEGVAQGEARAYPCSCDDDHDDDDELASLTGSEDRSWSCSPSTSCLLSRRNDFGNHRVGTNGAGVTCRLGVLSAARSQKKEKEQLG